MRRRNDVIMKGRLSLTSFCRKTLCFVHPRCPIRMYFVSPAVLPKCFDDTNFKRKPSGNYELFFANSAPKTLREFRGSSNLGCAMIHVSFC